MIQVVCFSRARPLQLHGYLASLFQQWTGTFTVSVLVRIDPPYADAYRDVQLDFPQVRFREERDFGADLAVLVDPDVEHTCFGCDDVVWIAPVDADMVASVFDMVPDVLAVSLRLGCNVRSSLFFGAMPQPAFSRQGVLVWQIADGQYDWAYPWELDGTVYPTAFARVLLQASSPNLLEDYGARHWRQITSKTRKTSMACFPSARLVVSTVNRVQSDFLNPICGGMPLSPELLLDCWQAGLRLDVQRFAERSETFSSVHVPEFYLHRP